MQWNIYWQYEWEFKPAGLEPGTTNFKPIMSSPQSFQNSDAIWLDTIKTNRLQKASSLQNQVSCGTLWWAFSWRTARSQIMEKSIQHSSIDWQLCQLHCPARMLSWHWHKTLFIFTAFFYQTTNHSEANQDSASHSFLQPSNSHNPLPLALIYNYQR